MGQALKLFLKTFVNVVPVSPVFVQECFEFFLILNDQVGKAGSGEGSGDAFDIRRGGADGNFKPFPREVPPKNQSYFLHCTPFPGK